MKFLSFILLFFTVTAYAQPHPITVANKCEVPIDVKVWALNVCSANWVPPNLPPSPLSTNWITIPPQSEIVVNPLYSITTFPGAHWHVARGVTTAITVPPGPHDARIRYNPTYCNPTIAWANSFVGSLFANWYNYVAQGWGESIVFDCI